MEDMLIARVRTYMQARWTKGGSYANWFCNGLCIEGQYTTHYKPNRTPSVLPVHAEFDALKYKAKRPTLNENTFVSIDGRVAEAGRCQIGFK